MSRGGGGNQEQHRTSTNSWEPPGGLARAAGGVLGVVAGEAHGLTRQGCAGPGSGPITEALADLARGYDAPPSGRTPTDVAQRCQGTTAPAWLLATAVALPDRRGLVADTLELATLAGVPRHSLPACVAYIELAAGLFAGKSTEAALRAGASIRIAPSDLQRTTPPLCGESAIDALAAGVWALTQPLPIGEVMDVLSALSTPGVAAAVAGLLGLKEGCGALPPAWHRPVEQVSECFALAAGLVRARGQSRASTVTDTAAGHAVPARAGDVGGGADVGALVAAYAITEELEAIGKPEASASDKEPEAIKERVPGEAATGVDVPTASAAVRPSRGGRTGCGQRQLEGAGSR